jgi:uncharacterized membrane protein YkoI
VFQRLAQTDRAHFDFNRETTMLARSFIGMFVMLGLSTFPRATSATEFPGTDIAGIHEEIRAFVKVPISVLDAIAIAEKRNASAKVVDISFDGRSDQPAYKVKVHQNDEIWSGVIDVGIGTIVGDGDVSPVSALGVDDKAELAGLNKVGVDLSRAVAIAEGHGFGKAISAGLDDIGNVLVFRVVVVIDGLLEMITIDPAAVSEK